MTTHRERLHPWLPAVIWTVAYLLCIGGGVYAPEVTNGWACGAFWVALPFCGLGVIVTMPKP
jgi:hypothetical protein